MLHQKAQNILLLEMSQLQSIIRLLQEKHRVIFIGGIFHLPHDIKFKWGTSTHKFDQNIRQEIWKSILGATGFGLHFNYGATDAGVGTYFYGTGGWITGMDLSVRF